MTWAEKADASGDPVSLERLFRGSTPDPRLSTPPELDSVIANLLRPGFPAMIELSPTQGAGRLRAYIDDVTRTDIHRIADVHHSPDVLKLLITSLARSVASEVTYATLAKGVRALAPTIDVQTVSGYLGLLQRLFVVEPQLPWTPSLRSRARVRTSPRFHLVDPALAAAALGAGEAALRNGLATLGVLFESAVVHDLTVFASALDGEVRAYRDSSGREIDAVITLPDGRWGTVEIKLGGGQVAAGVQSLNSAVDQIDFTAVGPPAFRLVVTGTGPILTTDEGTITAPLAALTP